MAQVTTPVMTDDTGKMIASAIASIYNTPVEQTVEDDGDVTQVLFPNILCHFTGTLTSLTITLNAPVSGELAQYHFDFLSGSTAPTLTMPNTVTMPNNFTVKANKRYEIDILNNYGAVISWQT